ncbi:porin family protein, partial [Vibrio parahaemolyticus]|nr:porin family protein [Vibrio parahaemolyticus]
LSPISEVTDTSFSGPRLSGYASYPLGAGFELYGKAGMTLYTLEYTYKVNGQSRTIEHTSVGGEAAAGLGWSYKHFGLNAEYVYSKNSD